MCKISVIVPVYNMEEYLDQCMESILYQTFTDFELIIVILEKFKFIIHFY